MRQTGLRLWLLLLSLPVLGSCAGMIGQSGTGVPVIEGTGDSMPPPPAQGDGRVPPAQPEPYRLPGVPPSPPVVEQVRPVANPAVVALLNTAEKERLSGRYEHAAAAIERAVGIEPQNALLWSRLAAIRFNQNNWQQANVLASRSNSLARNDRALQLQNWRIIAQAKARMGDSAGAAAARQMILRLGGNDS